MKDKCGVDISPGDVVDLYVSDIMSAYVLEVDEGGLADANGE